MLAEVTEVALMTEAVSTPETSVIIYQTTRRNIPDDRKPYSNTFLHHLV
jgi:hypothetical protein